jgi:predicted  nucleic acid-binding Zn-ribbon protein
MKPEVNKIIAKLPVDKNRTELAGVIKVALNEALRLQQEVDAQSDILDDYLTDIKEVEKNAMKFVQKLEEYKKTVINISTKSDSIEDELLGLQDTIAEKSNQLEDAMDIMDKAGLSTAEAESQLEDLIGASMSASRFADLAAELVNRADKMRSKINI